MTANARRRLAEDFAAALAADFPEHGTAAIANLRETKLDVYLRLVPQITPPESTAASPLGAMSDEEVLATLEAIRKLTGEEE